MIDWLFNLQAECDAERHRHLARQNNQINGALEEHRFYYADQIETSAATTGYLDRLSGISHVGNIVTGATWTEQPHAESEQLDTGFVPLVDADLAMFTTWQLPGLTCATSNLFEDNCYSKGPWQRRQTLLAAAKRTALWQGATLSIRPEDMRFAPGETYAKPKIVVFALLDNSGSMDRKQREIGRVFFRLVNRFLQIRYPQANLVLITHNNGAVVVDEATFFTTGSSGGTCCSSAYELALNLIKQTYAHPEWKRYIYHISDGDNLPGDHQRCLHLIQELLVYCQSIAYIETNCSLTNFPYHLSNSLAKVQNDSLTLLRMTCFADIPRALGVLFGPSHA